MNSPNGCHCKDPRAILCSLICPPDSVPEVSLHRKEKHSHPNNINSSETNSQIVGQLDRLGRELETFSGIVADLKTSLTHLEDNMESQRTAHEEEAPTSIEKIKEGMGKFFTCFANQLESEMID
ncbi:hypothetical protein FOMA001_g19826 [Fusarium oxysporum f. sp. matthiolae]|nr:hypothetical protein FOMA001_g19826 [Fusarium oxysporum f. sp. matthiolae]